MRKMRKSKESPAINGVKFSRVCICGDVLKLAYTPELGRAFWNCFSCFPHYAKASRRQREEFLLHWPF